MQDKVSADISTIESGQAEFEKKMTLDRQCKSIITVVEPQAQNICEELVLSCRVMV